MVKTYWGENILQSIPEHILTLNFDKKKNKLNKKNNIIININLFIDKNAHVR